MDTVTHLMPVTRTGPLISLMVLCLRFQSFSNLPAQHSTLFALVSHRLHCFVVVAYHLSTILLDPSTTLEWRLILTPATFETRSKRNREGVSIIVTGFAGSMKIVLASNFERPFGPNGIELHSYHNYTNTDSNRRTVTHKIKRIEIKVPGQHMNNRRERL